MNLRTLGFNYWFAEHATTLLQPGQEVARVVTVDRNAYLVRGEEQEVLGLLGASDGIDDSFSDIHALSLNCRFANCTHVQEPGCAVLQAIQADELSEDRYQSYLKLRKESEHYNMSYVEKRKKDKDFGRHVKAVMKHTRR
jgi:ribosome biogenesis GTPase / thiamine phosphate phosphatase